MRLGRNFVPPQAHSITWACFISTTGKVAGVSCPENLVPKFLDLGVQYFHGTVQALIQSSSDAYLDSMRKAAGRAGL